MRKPADLRRRLRDLLVALDPDAPPPAGARRTKSEVAATHAYRRKAQALARAVRAYPELVPLAGRYLECPPDSPEEAGLRARILDILGDHAGRFA